LSTRSAAKAHRQSLGRQQRNRAVKSATKTAIKKAIASIASSDAEAARQAVRQAVSLLDRAAKKGALHRRNVARHKSRLLGKFNAAVAPLPVATQEPAPAKKSSPRKRTQTARKEKTEKK